MSTLHATKSKSRPNILFIMSDDHSSNAISAYGSVLKEVAPTPQIDRIGQNGMRFDSCCCVNSICTPSRATILTGQHSHVNGVKTLSDALPAEAALLSEMLQENGYATALFGKWHLRAEPRGFDQWATLPGQGDYFDPLFSFSSPDAIPAGCAVPFGEAFESGVLAFYRFGSLGQLSGYVTDLITDMTLEWLSQHDTEKPFFLCCHHKAPHDHFEYPDHLSSYLEDVTIPEPATLFEDGDVLDEITRKYGSSMSDRWEPNNAVKWLMTGTQPQLGEVDFSGLDSKARTKKAYQHYMKSYLRAVRSIDDNVGRILDYLEQQGLADNTLVVYTSDQGMMLGEHDKVDKRWVFEESQRMPLLMQYPGRIEPGSVSPALIDNTDFAPTLLALAGIEVPSDMQGSSFEEALGSVSFEGKEAVYYRYWMHMAHHYVPAHYGIRTRQHKLIFFYGRRLDASGCFPDGPWSEPTEPGFELYDLYKDPLETRNVIDDPDYASIASELKKQLLELKQRLGDDDSQYPEILELEKLYFS